MTPPVDKALLDLEQLPLGVDETGVFRTLFVAYPDALIVADAAGKVVLANPSAASLLGYSVDELVGLEIDQLVSDQVRPQHAAYRAAFAREPQARPMGKQTELVARRKNGSEVVVEIALSPLQEHGIPLVVAAIRDIGAYPRMKQALQRAHYSEHLAQLGRLAVDTRDPQALLDQVPVRAAAALSVDVAMVYLLEKDLAELRVASAVGSVAGERPGHRVANRPDTSLGFVLSQGRSINVPDYRRETRFAVPPAYLDAGLTSGLAVPLSDRGRTIGVLAVRSREHRVFGEDEVRFLESLGNLLASSLQRAQSEEDAEPRPAARERGPADRRDRPRLQQPADDHPGQPGRCSRKHPALAGDAHGQQLVGRRDACRPARRRADQQAAHLLPAAAVAAECARRRHLAAFVRRHAAAHARPAHRDRCRRVAAKLRSSWPIPASSKPRCSTSPSMRATRCRTAGPCASRPSLSDGVPDDIGGGAAEPADSGLGVVAISISDTGMGMTDDVKERALEPFFTTKAAGRGTGLGLSTVYGFVKQSRGALRVDSAPGVGTTLTLYLPAQDSIDAAGRQVGRAAARSRPISHVLLVEDDTEVRAVIRRFLEGFGCRVTEADSAEQALLLLAPAVKYELLVTDIALGAGMRGTELAARVSESSPATAILLMSGFSSELLDADRDSPPAWELLRKPCSREELARAIASALGASGKS